MTCPGKMRDARLAIDSNAASVSWINAKEVAGNCDRQKVIDDGVSKRITLNAGPSIVRVGVINSGGTTAFFARFLDQNDEPLKGFTVSVVEAAK